MAVHGSPKIARADFGRSSRAAQLPASAYEEVASALRQKILSGEIDEGDRLPTELTLAQELRISRSTVREALRVLQAWGFARRVSPRVLIASRSTGEAAQRETHIALMERKATHNDVYETIHVLAPALVSLAAQRATPADIAILQSIIKLQISCRNDIIQTNQVVEKFQAAIATISRNPAMALARSSLRHVLMPAVQEPKAVAKLADWALNGHRKILATIESRDPEMAALVTRRHIEQFRRHWEEAGLDFQTEISSLGFGVG